MDGNSWRRRRIAAYLFLTGLKRRTTLGALAFLLPLGIWCVVSYVPCVWHPMIKVSDPGDIDWMTGKPLTYDIDHSDNYFVIDPEGNERIVEDAAPDYTGKLNPKLQKFLSPEGLKHQKHPPQPDWTTTDLLEALEKVTGEKLPPAA